MRLLSNDDVISVRWTSGAGANWTVSALLAQATSRGFTSFFTYYLYDNYPHILFFNPTLDNGILYLLDTITSGSNHKIGYYGGNYNSVVCRSNSSGTSLTNDTGVSLYNSTYQNRAYKCYDQDSISNPSQAEISFATTLSYSKIYVNNQDVTPITYTWQSVSSISGKNGILNLAQIKAESINDGEPVSGASDSAFTGMSDDNNVATLVDVGELNNNKAKVVYNIPALTSGNYSYAKLVYKQGFIPTSKDDGTAVDLDLTDLGTNKTITVSNIVSGSVYWFVIFTDKSESDAVSLGENTEGVFFELDLTTDGRDVIRYNPAKEFYGAKQGELVGNGVVQDGILEADDNITWYYDPTENPKNIPKNCTLTFEYDTYFWYSEGYLDWYVIDSNDAQVIYWCFDTQYAFQPNKWYNCKTVAKVENGKITRYKYMVDDVEVSCASGNIKMPCTDADDSVGISQIYFRLTTATDFKNMSIYYDFSEYHDGGGSGSGTTGRR